MIYVDSSVALAYLLAEASRPSPEFWDLELVSSRLLEYEVWNRIHARYMAEVRSRETQTLLAGVRMIDMTGDVLARALRLWPTPIRTLDALHLATAEYLRREGETIEVASFDSRLITGARALGIPIAAL